MNRKTALNELEKLLDTGFSVLTIKGLIHRIYDSIENESGTQSITPFQSEPKPKIPFNEEKKLQAPNDDFINTLLNCKRVQTYEEGKSVYTLFTAEFGKIKFYPKANKVHLCKDNLWKTPGTNWLTANLINE